MDGSEVNINELIEQLQDLQSEHGDIDVRLAMQPNWPMEYSIGAVGVSRGRQPVAYLSEGQQLGYLPGKAGAAVGWSDDHDDEVDEDDDDLPCHTCQTGDCACEADIAGRLETVAAILSDDEDLTVTVEHPGCVVVHAGRIGDPDQSFWFGTANGTWQGDLQDRAGNYLGQTLSTGVAADESDEQVIAQAILRALSEPDHGDSTPPETCPRCKHDDCVCEDYPGQHIGRQR